MNFSDLWTTPGVQITEVSYYMADVTMYTGTNGTMYIYISYFLCWFPVGVKMRDLGFLLLHLLNIVLIVRGFVSA